MAQKINEKRHKPDFGGEPIEKIPQTGDTEQDFNKAMVALRDDNYEAFIADLNTLTSDPKVKNLRDAIVDKFNSNEGVQVFFSGETAMPIRNIHPTQFEVDMEKSLKFPLKEKPAGIVDILAGKKALKLAGRPLVVAEIEGVNYIIDGHHRWSQVYCLNPDASMVVRVLKSDMLKHPDDALKLVQMEIFVAKDGRELPQSKVDSGYNLYTIDHDSFRGWCENTMSDDAKRVFDKMLPKQDPIEFMWKNVETMRQEAQPTSNAHGREDMPQTDKVDGEFIAPKAANVSESKERKNKMNKLNISKERFEKSRYFQRKYGKLEYVSESGNMYKTNKGKVLMFKESSSRYGLNDVKTDGDVFRAIEEICSSDGMDSESIFTNCARHQVVWGLEEKLLNGEGLNTIDRLNIACLLASNLDHDDRYEPMDGYNESTRKFGKKFTKESIDADPALVCPYCGGNNCEVSIGSDDLNFTNLDRLQGETFNIECWCNDCDKPYNVTLELNVKDVYPNEDFSDEYI